jgi:Thioredoxin
VTTMSEQVRDSGSRTRRGGPDRPTLCFFFSPTSGPSRRVEAFLAQVLQRRQNHRAFSVRRVNCDKHPELVERFAIKHMPTLIVIEDRKVSGRLEGSCGCRQIEKLLAPWLNHQAGRGSVASVEGNSNESVGEARVHGPWEGSSQTAYTRVGLRLPAHLSFERWKALGRQIGSVATASCWWLGDWVSYGEGCYGEKYKQAIAVTGFDYQTLRNYAWVAGRFDVSRRRDTLSFAHHAEVAALPEEEQDEWLDLAERSRWSRNELRARLRNEKRARIPSGVEQLRMNVEAARVERWRVAAEAQGLDLTEWLVAAADDAAQRLVPSVAGNGARAGRRPTRTARAKKQGARAA